MNSSLKNIINSPVTITALGFDRKMQSFPRRMEWQGNTYYFTEAGLRVKSGLGCQTLTMSDGVRNFCLRLKGSAWTLVSVS